MAHQKLLLNVFQNHYDLSQLNDEGSLFTEYDLSSIDFIDLCFELGQKSKINFQPNELWPFNKMLTNPEYYSQENWTDKGWEEVCAILGMDVASPKCSIRDLYHHFTINYIHRRLGSFV